VTAVIAWHPDRLHRSLKELEEFITVIETNQVEVHTVAAGDLDLSTPVGRMVARQLGTFARYESEHRSQRVAAAHNDLAMRGCWSGGPGPYGYDLHRDENGRSLKDGTLVIVPEQAKIIREAARRLLAGETIYSICADLTRRGVPSSKGGPWRQTALHRILTGPTTAGLREHHGVVVGKGLWPAILSPEQSRLLRERLTDVRRTTAGRRVKLNLLVGGLCECGRCGRRLVAGRRFDTARRIYRCVKSVDHDGCGGVSVSADHLENHVVDAVFDRLGRDTATALVANPKAFTRELQRRAEADARMQELAAMYASGEITRQEWAMARKPLAVQLADTPRDPAHLGGLRLGNPEQLRDQWDALNIERRRAFLALVIDTAVVHPTTQRGPKFDTRRVQIRWR
jgi:site-specific DNA recombinase